MSCLERLVIIVIAVATGAPVAAQSVILPLATSQTEILAPASGDSAELSDVSTGDPLRLPREVNAPRPLFAPIGQDFRSLFTGQTARTISLFALSALVATPLDALADAGERSGPRPVFAAGRIGGSFLVQTGAAAGTYLIGQASGTKAVSALGADLIRAQLLSQAIVQAGKFATQRQRPDGSNRHSLPSGHTASAFATAGVLQQHFGWKVGVPAHVFAAYVGASRIGENKHHLSDAVLGAGLGFVAARIVTVPMGGHDFGLSVAPTQGGAAFTFSPK